MDDDGARDPFRTFRPWWTRVAVVVTGIFAAGGSIVIGLFAPQGVLLGPATRVTFVAFALFAVWLLWRLGGVHARPDADGLTVRNVISRRRVAWPEIVAVRLTVNDPWVTLDLADGGTLAVMGIQRADGERGMAEARRLQALARQLGEAPDRP
ncbi:PH (Pleckstrin Homology) domain-containing protein [Isoptericola sp. CG 20/1183]|uniref:PH (Pleckstrin Homology) domain-containing protein n=1 Tax=Isoptericola halotolerans TaxID=300560 RepID=A0ABX5EAZ8_9MICO|nr:MULTISPECIES: PH domain-containing protein [Isoptericola]PRZ04447.1 PH (Pleckstrin Homology) domain-containing protein [Isoptericola halotolerans]PRZ04655.1 PH (Pleckstrin Homology) domain-containing protein [Isoptericola sp. CG 20/1183]